MKTKIEWADFTFNPWLGCSKVSPACKNCYAEGWAKRSGLVRWGDQAERRRTSASYWRQPLLWNREAKKAGERWSVFCASLADVFEDRPELAAWRLDLLKLIEQCGHLHWLLLTKRPQNVTRMIEAAQDFAGAEKSARAWLLRNPHVRIGTTVENQEEADRRIRELLRIPAAVRFLSVEPLLGPIDLRLTVKFLGGGEAVKDIARDLHWVIVGGESGPNARECSLDWIHSLVEQCSAAEVPVFVKQLGARPYYLDNKTGAKTPFPISDRKGGHIGDFPCHFLREWPRV